MWYVYVELPLGMLFVNIAITVFGIYVCMRINYMQREVEAPLYSALHILGPLGM